jgi:hypothetical protein
VVVNFRSFLLFAVRPRLNCESLENVFVPETSTKRANTPHIHGNCIIAPQRRALLFWLASLSKTSPGPGFGTAGQSRRDGKAKSNRQLIPIETSSSKALGSSPRGKLIGRSAAWRVSACKELSASWK